jgi:hypothetical protein
MQIARNSKIQKLFMSSTSLISGGLGQVIGAHKNKSKWQWWFLGIVIGLLPCANNYRLLHDSRLVVLWTTYQSTYFQPRAPFRLNSTRSVAA